LISREKGQTSGGNIEKFIKKKGKIIITRVGGPNQNPPNKKQKTKTETEKENNPKKNYGNYS